MNYMKKDDPANYHLKQSVCDYVLYDKTRAGGAAGGANSDQGGTVSSNSYG